MTIEQLKALKPGDKVRWNDPDNDLCSKTVTIDDINSTDIKFDDDIVIIEYKRNPRSRTFDYIECLASELSLIN
jgi:hypothetical protein